jgi:RimJ/RimL family protein N-acetyltransferase
MPPLPLVTLEGAHVRLEPLTLGHLGGLLDVATGARATYTLTTVPASETAMRAYIETALADQAAGRALPFAIIDRRAGDGGAGRGVGSTRFGNIEFWAWPPGNAHQRGEHLPDAVEIGWTWLAEAAQRTPINTEAKLLMLRHAFERWRVHRVRLMTDARNTRSRNAILCLGACFDGVLRAAREASDGAIRDTAAYSILEAEWPAVKAGLERRLAGGARLTTQEGQAAGLETYARLPREERLARLGRTVAELAAAIDGRSAGELARRPDAKNWAAVEVLCHLRDVEESFLDRCRLITLADEPTLITTNPDRWAEERQYLRHDAGAALAAFRARRDDTLAFFTRLAPTAWERAGHQMDSRGRRTIDDFLSVMAWHDLNHLEQLRRALG